MGTFTAGKLQVRIDHGKLSIVQEGKQIKFRTGVEQKTFSGSYASKEGKQVLYVTERCVFRLGENGLELAEIAPGVDLEKDILPFMEFKPFIRPDLHLMDARIFNPEPMGLKDELLSIPIEERFVYNAEDNLFFVNFENYYVKTSAQIQQIKEMVEGILAPVGRKALAIVNYDNFNILPELVDEYTDMVKYVLRYYESVTRYTTSTFLRMKLGDELKKRDLSPYIYETREEARKTLLAMKK